MKSRSNGSTSDPLSYAFRLLNLRGRSTKELSFRLKLKGFSTEEIESTIEYLKNRGFIDDLALARQLLDYGLNVKGYGIKGLRDFLRKRGIKEDQIRELLDDNLDEYPAALKVATRALEKNKNRPKEVQKQRIYGLLYRRGYSYDTIKRVLKELSID
ncbi:MAG: regulatory protein RecX [Nitrospirae bacterium]|nr:regulatory protein RecX [Nitrospirota bacterium]